MWLIHLSVMTHPCVRHDAFISVTWGIHMCDMTHSYVWHDTYITWQYLMQSCPTHSCVWHDSFICVTWLIHMCDMTHSYVWHDSFICVTGLIYICDVTHPNVWHDSRHTHPMHDTCHIWMSHVTHMNASYHTYDCIGCWGHDSIKAFICDMCHHLMRSYVTRFIWWYELCDVTNYVMSRTMLWYELHYDSSQHQMRSHVSISPIRTCDMTHSYVRCDICVTWLVHMCDMTHS